MSGLLDGLATLTAPVAIRDERGEHQAVTNAITWVKRDDVREALRSDETVADLVMVVYDALADASLEATIRRDEFVARAVLAALAGDDQ